MSSLPHPHSLPTQRPVQPRTGAPPAIRLIDVRRRFRSGAQTIEAVAGVTFELPPGSVVALVGPSGSGKSTLFNIIIGADQPDGGTVERRPGLTERWSDIAFVPQGLGLLNELTIEENIGLPLRLTGPGGRTAAKVLGLLGLTDSAARFPDEVSLGEQQRAAVARAIIGDPNVLLADEPTAHQDERNARIIAAELRRAADRGAAVLIATHEQRILDNVDLMLSLVDGRLADA